MSRPGNLAPGIYATLYYTHLLFHGNFDAAGKETLFSVIEWWESYGIANWALSGRAELQGSEWGLKKAVVLLDSPDSRTKQEVGPEMA